MWNRHSGCVRALTAGAVLGVLLLGVGVAEAKIPPLLEPGTRPFFAMFGFGGAIRIHQSPTQGKLVQDFGYHLFGGMEGPAIGGSISESFGEGAFALQVGPKFWWDFRLISGLGLYLAPVAQLGFALMHYDFGRRDAFGLSAGSITRGYFNFQFGAEARLVLGNRGIVYWRPLTFDLFAGENFGARYDMMIGGGVIF